MAKNNTDKEAPLWEVFVQEADASAHEHVGSVHASDSELALQNARDVFARRQKLKSIWVVPSVAITASAPESEGELFDSASDKVYRHPQFYKTSKGSAE
jgi:ring-1,2-phenylacetyl-CoA epoxidase subunit PaaB